MDRKMIIGILGQMPTEQLLKALAVASGAGDGADGGDPLEALAMDGGNNKIQSWGDRSVPYNGGGDRPAIADKKWAQGAGGQGAQPREGQLDDGVDPTNIFLQTGGGS